MKYLAALIVAQTTIIVAFAFQMSALKAELGALALSANTALQETTAHFSASNEQKPVSSPKQTNLALNGDQIRLIIRDEIKQSMQPATRANETAPQAQSAQQLATQARARQEFEQSFNQFVALGEIDAPEMAALQMKIARLPPQDRTRALTRLTKAMNAGDLKGAL